MTEIQTKCPKGCGRETRMYSVAGRECREVCDECQASERIEAESERMAARVKAAGERVDAIFRRFPLYNPVGTRWEDVGERFRVAAGEWMQREDKRRGLWLCGDSGKGKTRTIFGLMRRIAELGQMVGYSSHQHFCDLVAGSAMRETNAMRELDQLRRADVLILDDLGKGRATDAATLGLYAIVEHFVSRGKPILATSQSDGPWMSARLGDDAGAAIVRRLTEFCEIAKVNHSGAREATSNPVVSCESTNGDPCA